MPKVAAEGALAVHNPGAGIDFTTVGLVHVARSDQLGPALPKGAMPGIRLAAPERLRSVTAADVAVGDLLVTVSERRRTARLGRPMQVIYVDDAGEAVVLDDRTLPRSALVHSAFVPLIESRERTVAWHVLAAFGIGRCPRCQAPGLRLEYGLLPGPPTPGYEAGGCSVPLLAADLVCPRCGAEWNLPSWPVRIDSADT